jgi:hypothetical protein
MKSYTITTVIAFLSLVAGVVLLIERQPKAQSVVDTLSKRTVKIKMRLGSPSDPSQIVNAAFTVLDSTTYFKKQAREDAADRKAGANLYLQKLIDKNINYGLATQQRMMERIDALKRQNDSLIHLVNEKPKVIYLTPQIIQTDTIRRGLFPIPQNSNKGRRGQERTIEGVEKFYKDSIIRGGSSQRVVGYLVS